MPGDDGSQDDASQDDASRATRAAYDAVARAYARLLPDLTAETPLDRAALAAFAEMVEPGGLVVDLGCGTGRLTRHLADGGLRVLGVDLSPGMLAVGRAARPDLLLAAGHAAALPLPAASVAGLVAWYSLVHLPASRLPAVCDELARVTRPGAPVLVAFHSGDGERVDREVSYGEPVPLTYHRHRVEVVAEALAHAGFAPYGTVCRAGLLSFETTPQAALLVLRA